MKHWDVSGDGLPWKVKLDVRDLGGHLDFTGPASAGTLSQRVKHATHGVAAVGALLLGFQVKLGLIRGKHLPALLHAVEASYVSASSLSAFRAAIVRTVWSCKMPFANTHAILTLLVGPVGVDPVYHIVRARFRVMRRNHLQNTQRTTHNTQHTTHNTQHTTHNTQHTTTHIHTTHTHQHNTHRWCRTRTKPYGDRRHHLRGSGRLL